MRRTIALLARLEKAELDRGRLALQAVEGELAARQEELGALACRVAIEHATGWTLPGGPRPAAAYATAAFVQQTRLHRRCDELAAAQRAAEASLHRQLGRYKSLDLANRQLRAAERAGELSRAQADLEEAGQLRAACRAIGRNPSG